MRTLIQVPGVQLSRQTHEAGRVNGSECDERLMVSAKDVIAAWALALGILFGLMAWSLL